MVSYDSIDKTNPAQIVITLTNLLADQPGLDAAYKGRLLESLLNDLDNVELQLQWNDQARLLAIQTVKTLGREPTVAEILFSDKGIATLLRFSTILEPTFTDAPLNIEALKCIANSLYLVATAKDVFWNQGGVAACAVVLKNDDISFSAHFLLWRILFLMSVDRLDVVKLLIDEHNISDVLGAALEKHVAIIEANPVICVPSTEINTPVMAIIEALKTLYNIMLNAIKLQSHGLPVEGIDEIKAEPGPKTEDDDETHLAPVVAKFERCLPPLLKILLDIPPEDPTNPLLPPHSHAVHALLNYPVQPYADSFFPKDRPSALPTTLAEILDKTLALGTALPDDMPQAFIDTVESSLPPLLVLLSRLSKGDEGARTLLKDLLLPDNIDRTKSLQKGPSLSARLIRCMSCAMMPNVMTLVSKLLFIICNEDAEILIKHTGLGNAAGFLTACNILVTPSIANAQQDPEPLPFNPVTGQYWDEPALDLATMTDEEKEREAERLFVLFERLNNTGVVSVENPIAKAMRESD